MRKSISILLLLVMCLGLAACGKGGSKSSGKVDDAYVGEWIAYTGTYESSGNITSAEKVTLTLNEDGSALYGSTKGTWGYIESKNEVHIKLPEEELDLGVNQIDGHTVLGWSNNDFYEAFFREEKDSYAVAYNRIVREWYSENGNVLCFQEGGTMLYNSEVLESTWSILCLGPYIVLDYGGGKPEVVKLNVTSQNDIRLDIFMEEGAFNFYSSEYATLITVDDWTEHFSSNLEDVFDISYEIEYITNEWGETNLSDGCYVYQNFALRSAEQYGEKTALTVEFACGADAQKFWIDEETQSVLQERVDESPLNGEKITFSFSPNLYSGDYIYLPADEFKYHAASGEIVRMKGILFKAEFDSLPQYASYA